MTPQAVSVVIPTYNRALLLPRAIRSALAAVRPGDEILVVDDGSTDNTEAVLAPFAGQIRYLPGPHAGVGATRNRGILAATKPLVAFLDSDDEWDKDKLDLQRTILAACPDLLFLFSDFRGVDEHGQVSPHYLLQWSFDDRGWDEILGPSVPYSQLADLPSGRPDFAIHRGSMYRQLLLRSYVSATTMLVRREAAGDALRFGEDVVIYEDLECFARLAKAGLAGYCDCELATQHAHSGPRVTDANMEEMTRCRIKVLDRNWGKDEAFLKAHRSEYRQQLAEIRLTRARWFLCRGRGTEARQELAEIDRIPVSYRVLAAMPSFLSQGLLNVRRLLRQGKARV